MSGEPSFSALRSRVARSSLDQRSESSRRCSRRRNGTPLPAPGQDRSPVNALLHWLCNCVSCPSLALDRYHRPMDWAVTAGCAGTGIQPGGKMSGSVNRFDAIVIGAGQAGPSLTGRLTAAGMTGCRHRAQACRGHLRQYRLHGSRGRRRGGSRHGPFESGRGSRPCRASWQGVAEHRRDRPRLIQGRGQRYPVMSAGLPASCTSGTYLQASGCEPSRSVKP